MDGKQTRCVLQGFNWRTIVEEIIEPEIEFWAVNRQPGNYAVAIRPAFETSTRCRIVPNAAA